MQRLQIWLTLVMVFGAGSARGTEDASGWREFVTPHFHLYTDLADRAARRVLEDCEATYAALAEVGFALGDVPAVTTDLVVFRSRHEYASFAPAERVVAFFTDDRHLSEPRPTVVMSSGLDQRSREVFQHELTHRFVHRFILDPPLWLNEGLAELFSTLRFDKGQVIIGEQPSQYRFVAGASSAAFVHGLVVSRLPSIRELAVAGDERFHDRRHERGPYFYAGSWVLLHLLFNGPEDYRPKFIAYFTALARGQSHEDAFSTTLETIGVERLEEEYRRYVMRDTTRIIKERYTPPPPPEPTVRALPESEVHLLWATLRSWDPDKKEPYARARADLERAQALAPDAPEVRALAARFAGLPEASSDPLAATDIPFAGDMPGIPVDAGHAGRPAILGPTAELGEATLKLGMRMLSQATLVCHERYPAAEGEMMIEAVIEKSGKVSAAETRGRLARTPAGRCIQQLAAKAKFPPFEGAPMRASFPITLRK
jgi:hypothetical protein